MAQPALDKFNRRGIALAIQTLAGTPEAVSAATHGVLLYDGKSGTDFDSVEDSPDRPHFTGKPFAVANKRAFIEGSFRLVPPTVPGHAVNGIPACDVLLRGGGMTRVLDAAGRTTRYNPISQGMVITTAHFWHAGTFKEVFDARHQLSALMSEVGSRDKGTARIQGSYEDVAEDALPTVTVDAAVGPVLSAANGRTRISVDGGADLNVWGKSLTIDPSSDLKTKEYTEHKETAIDGRNPTWTLKIAKTALADFNPWAARDAASLFEGDQRVKGDDGRYTMKGFRGQISAVNETDIDGDYGWELSGPCVASDTGGDEFYIEFGDASLALTGTLSNVVEDIPYAGTTALTAIGEYETLTWSISTGSLPTGLTIDAGTGVISGSPTTVGSYPFTVQATDGVQTATSEQEVTISTP